MRIVVDAMGGDHAPRAIVRGALQASREFGDAIVLVGQEPVVREELRLAGASPNEVEVVHASEVVEMCEVPGQAIIRKKDSSIRVGLQIVNEGKADAFVSAGNSGAVMAGALLILKRIPGIDRPAIVTRIPTPLGSIVLLDAGANVECEPPHLLQFGVMGEAYARKALGIEVPRVGMVSIGEEESKGSTLTRAAADLLRVSPLKFIGNVEGRDFFNGKADVFVCDGFVGNVVLKTMEGMAFALIRMLKEEIRKSPLAIVGAAMASGAIKGVKRKLDYAEIGGAPLLGVRGGVIIAHGSSDERAIRSAIRSADTLCDGHVEDEIARMMEAVAASSAARGV